MNRSLQLAAWAAVAALGISTAATAQVTPPPTDDPVVVQDGRYVPVEPVYMAEPVAVESGEPDRPLMALVKQSEAGQQLADDGFFVKGHAQAGWTIADDNQPGGIIVGRLFDQEEQDLTFHQLQVSIGREATVGPDAWDFGGQLDLLWGGDARFMHSNGLFDYQGFNDGPDEQFDIPQAYVQIGAPVGTGLGLLVGKWITLGGYEVVDPTGNTLYSHGYIFNACLPFAHTGVLGSYSVSEEWSFDLGISRGWDQWEDNNDYLDFIGRASWASPDEQTAVYTTGYAGPQLPDNNDDWRYVLDVVATHQYADNLSTAANFNYGYDEGGDPNGGAGQWVALEGWGSLDWSDQVALNTRAGWLNDDEGTKGFGCDVYHLTVGLGLTPFPNDQYGQWLKIRPEVRADYGEQAVFDGGTDHLQATFGVDAVYAF